MVAEHSAGETGDAVVTRYTVIQFVPDTVADERINIGVMAFRGGDVRARFLTNWTRVRNFVERDTRFLEWFARDIQANATSAGVGLFDELRGQLNDKAVARLIGEWKNSIQFTPTRTSLKAPADLISDLARWFLVEPESHGRAYRDREDAGRLVAHTVRHALDRSGSRVSELL